MPCIEGVPQTAWRRLACGAGWLLVLALAGCASRTPAPPPVSTPSPSGPGPASPAAPGPGAASNVPAPQGLKPPPTPAVPQPRPGPAPVPGAPQAGPALPAALPVRNWEEYRLQAARRLVAAHPGGSYMGRVPDVLLAIPVLEVELHADGRVREVRVLRQPGQARDTVQLAIAAIHRAAPYGPVGHLPRPWRFTEAFLFDDARRFKPRSLD